MANGKKQMSISVVPRGRHIKDNKRKRLCRSCHSDVHGLYSEAFKKKYGKNRADFIKVKTLMPKGGFTLNKCGLDNGIESKYATPDGCTNPNCDDDCLLQDMGDDNGIHK